MSMETLATTPDRAIDLGSSIAQAAYGLSGAAAALARLTGDGRADAAGYFLDLAYWKAGDTAWDIGHRGVPGEPDQEAESYAAAKLAAAVQDIREALQALERLAQALGRTEI